MDVIVVSGALISSIPLFGYLFFASYRAGHSDGRTQGYDAWIITRSLHPFKFFYTLGYKAGDEERTLEQSIENMRKNILGY